MRKVIIVAVILEFLLLLGPGVWQRGKSPGMQPGLVLAEAATSASYRLEPQAHNAGGGSSSSNSYGLRDSLGWPPYGYATSGSYRLYGGFVPETLLTVRAFVPVAFKSFPRGW